MASGRNKTRRTGPGYYTYTTRRGKNSSSPTTTNPLPSHQSTPNPTPPHPLRQRRRPHSAVMSVAGEEGERQGDERLAGPSVECSGPGMTSHPLPAHSQRIHARNKSVHLERVCVYLSSNPSLSRRGGHPAARPGPGMESSWAARPMSQHHARARGRRALREAAERTNKTPTVLYRSEACPIIQSVSPLSPSTFHSRSK
jgi:hypothetical protein